MSGVLARPDISAINIAYWRIVRWRHGTSSAGSPVEPPSNAYLSEDDLRRPAFQPHANRVKNDLLAHLIDQQRAGRRIAAYGAAAKGNTLLNDACIKPDLLPYVCDAAPAKQGKYLPGGHIPIRPPVALRDQPPDEVLILPWNIAEEVKAQLADLAGRGTRFVTVVPALRVHQSG